ncbi:hypothetical protein [Pseudonocardia sp. ICBG1142]|uniref:hypothetical protein n=1 Tax=Pseudonocardia sp. ICBG1142 TaxID=2846760 RepID=UPI001CF6CE5A|nr:hypothetical protein [Pseudonocardia sp. ICBG1142]
MEVPQRLRCGLERAATEPTQRAHATGQRRCGTIGATEAAWKFRSGADVLSSARRVVAPNWCMRAATPFRRRLHALKARRELRYGCRRTWHLRCERLRHAHGRTRRMALHAVERATHADDHAIGRDPHGYTRTGWSFRSGQITADLTLEAAHTRVPRGH